jgi:uncharacterized membrane protein
MKEPTIEVEVTTVVDRPVGTVWDFYAVHHVQNHPRWDPDIALEEVSGRPLEVGTLIKRWNTRYDTPTEGTMRITEFDPERVMSVKTQEGPIETNGSASFVAEGANRTSITLRGEFPGMDDSMAEKIRPLMERSARTIKQLIESET